MSSISLLGIPSDMYVYGTMYVMLIFSFPICMVITAHFIMPVFFDLGVTSAFEVLYNFKSQQ